MSHKFRTTTLALAVSVALGNAPAFSAESEQTAKDKDVERIAVVGSRSAPRSVAESPVPVDIVGGDELGKNASSDMLDMLQGAIPSFNVRQQPISDAASFIRPVNLRGLSSDSTLILLNGKRRHRASVIAFQGGGVNDGAQGPDISVIPGVAIKQVEVLRDGAAAQYGSDAIAGVMNFVLKDDADGGSMSVKHGEYYEGDGTSTIVDGNIGLPFTRDGFANFSFQLKDADATSRSIQRPDAAALIAAGNTAVADPAMVWGNPEIKDDITLFGNIGLDLGDDKEFYMFGNYSERTGTGGYYYRNPHDRKGVFTDVHTDEPLVGDMDGVGVGIECPTVTLSSDNILTQADYALIADPNTAVGQNCFMFNEIFPGGYTPIFSSDIDDQSLTAGVRGEIKSGFLSGSMFDLSASVGRNKSSYQLVNTVNPSTGPEQPVGHKFDAGSYIQLEKTFNADIVREVEVGLEMPLNVAGGFEFREESFEIISGDELSWKVGPLRSQGFSAGSHGFAGFSPESQGINTRRNIAAYLDVEAQMTEDLLLGGAIRFEDYNTFGNTTDYKITAQYQVNDEISVRGSHSTGFRAPTVGQANVVNTQTSLIEGELVQSATFPPTHPLSAFYGGKELTPEESKSFAVGLVYQSGDLFLTADLYNIEVTDRISQTSSIPVPVTDYAALNNLGITNLPERVTFFANDFDTTTKGLDVVGNYSTDLFNGTTMFSLAYNWNKTEVDNTKGLTGEFKIKRLEEGIPEHRATFTISQTWDEVSMFIRANYFGEYYATHADEPDLGGPDGYGWSDTGDAAVTIDAEISYYFSDSITLSAGANNLFDTEAHKLQEVNGDYGSRGIVGAVYYESGPFDYNGGFYYLKATYNF
ncbi:TonB-dependent receptor plug domain-containing protein [Thalassotalea ganghwensis]